MSACMSVCYWVVKENAFLCSGHIKKMFPKHGINSHRGLGRMVAPSLSQAWWRGRWGDPFQLAGYQGLRRHASPSPGSLCGLTLAHSWRAVWRRPNPKEVYLGVKRHSKQAGCELGRAAGSVALTYGLPLSLPYAASQIPWDGLLSHSPSVLSWGSRSTVARRKAARRAQKGLAAPEEQPFETGAIRGLCAQILLLSGS